mgnify:CR=1 FL=1|jgi:ribonuclease Z
MLVTIDSRFYIFNCPDGLQRTLLSHRDFQLSRTKYVFLSSNSPAYRGGLPGIYLSGRDHCR